MGKIIAYILLTWVGIGRAHQIWHKYLKGIPVKMYAQVAWNNRIEILETGALGYLTPYFHWKWHKNKPKQRELGSNVRKMYNSK